MKADIVVKGIIWNSRINRILIVQRSKTDSIGADTWENIGGNLEEGEYPEDIYIYMESDELSLR